ncbi:SCP-like extracellular protein [Aspergillus luchuensis]|uniref:SCP-like extracellular protein n=1 Tax=Aspergillus kawachii TaxID=1069201 RepID=A0A146FU40_ASPKA|nr:SCP-like extracellular protein [Aspergillus luchuensis]
MRYSLALGALCAAGALANNVDKRSYVTDWTVVTLTTTITEYPTPTVYENVAAQEATAAASSSSAAAAAAAAESSSSAAAAAAAASASAEASSSAAAAAAAAAAEASTSSVVTPVVETTAAATTAAAVATSAAEEVATSWTSAWTSAWTSSWSSTVAPSTTLATSTSSSASSTATNAYQSAVLYNHNVHRSNHSASSASEIGVMITNLMYNDEMGYYTDLYGEADPDMTYFDNWGHFSQIVWAATTHVGCATVTCDSLGNVDASEALPFTVCNYSPAGNYEGEYATNVKRPLGQAVYVAS